VVLHDLSPAIAHHSLESALSAAAHVGANALQVPSVAWLSASLDESELRKVRAVVSAHAMELTATLGPLNACWPERMSELLALGGGDVDIGIERSVRAASAAGISALHVTCGQLQDRSVTTPTWSEQLSRNAALVVSAAGLAAAEGIELVLQTHEEMSSWEAVAIADASDGTVQLGFNPVSLLVGMEDPLLAAARVAAVTHTVFVDDAALYRTDTGLHRKLRVVGEGVIDWHAVLGVLEAISTNGFHMSLDLHRASFDIPFFLPDWFTEHSDIGIDDMTRVCALASKSDASDATIEQRFSGGVHAIRRFLARGS
jgi:sugar phosphate isomerase/epimerase